MSETTYNFKTEQQIIDAALAIMESRSPFYGQKTKTSMRSPAVAKDYFRARIGDKPHEVFSVAFLSAQHDLLSCEDMFFGTINAAAVYPREVVRRALETNASAVILAHNHPSGITTPSDNDRRITDRLKEALETVDISVLDHFIVTNCNAISFAEEGYI